MAAKHAMGILLSKPGMTTTAIKRNIPCAIAESFDVTHESPQILLIKNGVCVYDESHNGITMDEIIEQSASAW